MMMDDADDDDDEEEEEVHVKWMLIIISISIGIGISIRLFEDGAYGDMARNSTTEKLLLYNTFHQLVHLAHWH